MTDDGRDKRLDPEAAAPGFVKNIFKTSRPHVIIEAK